MRVGRGRQGYFRDIAEALRHLCNAQILRPEIVAPLRHAVRLVDREQGNGDSLKKSLKAFGQQALRGDIQKVDRPCDHPPFDASGLIRGEAGVQEIGAQAVLPQGLNLVLHQCDQGRDDQPHPRAQNRRDLVAKGLPAAGRHQHERVLSADHAFDDVQLMGAEGAVAVVFSEDIVRRHCVERAPMGLTSVFLLEATDDVAAGLLVPLQIHEAARCRLLQQAVERAETVVRFGESGPAAFEGLLDHRPPDFLLRTALLGQRLERLHDQIEGCLGAILRLLVFFVFLDRRHGGPPGRGRPGCFARRPFARLLLAHKVVVIDELVAVGDQQIGTGAFDAHPDHDLVVLAQFADQRGEVGIAADDHKRVHVGLGVAQVQGVHDHADVGGVLPRLAHVRDFDQFEGGLVHRPLEILVAFPVAVGFFHHDAALEQQPLEHLADVKLGVAFIPHPDRDVFKIAEHGQVLGFRLLAHPILPGRRPHARAWPLRKRAVKNGIPALIRRCVAFGNFSFPENESPVKGNFPTGMLIRIRGVVRVSQVGYSVIFFSGLWYGWTGWIERGLKRGT